MFNIFKKNNFNLPEIEIIMGDITKQNVDVIVNAADETLSGGTGVDGAIHKAAGENLLKYIHKNIKSKPRCHTGKAVLTPGFNIPSKHIIHTVAPIWQSGDEKQIEYNLKTLKYCYLNCFKIADSLDIKTIAFPCLGAGAYGWSTWDVADISKEVSLIKRRNIKKIKFITYNLNDTIIFEEVFKKTASIPRNIERKDFLYYDGVS